MATAKRALGLTIVCVLLSGVSARTLHAAPPSAPVVPAGTPLVNQNDLASEMIDGIDRFLLRKTAAALANRESRWHVAFDSTESYWQSLAKKRERLGTLIGATDARIGPLNQLPQTITMEAGDEMVVRSFRIPVLQDPDPNRTIASVWCEGVLVSPRDRSKVVADVIAVGDCDQTPAELFGLAPGTSDGLQFARELAQRGCRVAVPMLINRELTPRGGRARLSTREYVYRPSYLLGRHVLGYEVQKIRSLIDWLRSTPSSSNESAGGEAGQPLPLGLVGYREGARLALLTAALDRRPDAVCLSGDFGAGQSIWSQPADRNVFGILNGFTDAELLAMAAPRTFVIHTCPFEPIELSGEGGGAPGTIEPVTSKRARAETELARRLAEPLVEQAPWTIDEIETETSGCDRQTVSVFLKRLTGRVTTAELAFAAQEHFPAHDKLDEQAMQRRCVEEIDRHNQLLLRESPFAREEFFAALKFDSVAEYEESVEPYRKVFREQVIGQFDDELQDPNPRIRKTWLTDAWTGYEVVLDVFPDVIAYGALLIPNDLKPGEKRPVVVCQHGLEGRPTDTFLDDHRAYHDYAAKLAERGMIVFAPQNPYLFKDRFRTLQRKANPLGKTLFSVIVPQHQQIVNWLKSQPFVDGDRIAFYGLSYGGKSAMRIPALVKDYCLSICSADFNEWVRKNASTRHRFSYVWTGEYEIFEWNLGGTFNYAEMAALICPRPFMVERGHFDGVGTDQWVAYEYAKVRHLYAARLKLADRTEIEWFDGPHMINGEGTFEFLHRHLNWPAPTTNDPQSPR